LKFPSDKYFKRLEKIIETFLYWLNIVKKKKIDKINEKMKLIIKIKEDFYLVGIEYKF